MKLWIDNVQLVGEEGTLSCLIAENAQQGLERNTYVSLKITIVLAKSKRSYKYLRLGRCWKAS